MSTNHDMDAAKDRLVDSLNSARDVALSAVRDDIAPAVAAAVDAAREASGPVYAEATSRAGDAISALRGSDAVKSLRETGSDGVKSLRDSDTVQALAARASRPRTRRRRWPLIAAILAATAAGVAVLKRRSDDGPILIDVTDTPPKSTAATASEDAPVTDGEPPSA